MAVSLISPKASFVSFGSAPEEHCVFGTVDPCLPIVYANDHAFQFAAQGTEGEVQALFGDTLRLGLVYDEDDAGFAIEFPNTSERSLLTPTQVLYNWSGGFPGFTGVIGVGECFKVRVILAGQTFNSTTCFKRFAVDDPDVCWTSVIEYSGQGAAFGFFSCGPADGDYTPPAEGEEPTPTMDCKPTAIPFDNVPTLTIPVTQEYRDKYGDIPTFNSWIYDSNGVLTNMGVQAVLTGYPVTSVTWDFGGPASGYVTIS